MTITEKVAHLKGLIEGLALDSDKKETKVISAIVDILDDIALDMADMEEEQAVMADYIDELDYDLGDVESYLFEEDDDDNDDDDDCDCGCDCDDEEFLEAECPACHATFCFEADADPEDIVCPACGGHFTCICQCDDEEADCNNCVHTSEDDDENEAKD